MIGKFSKFAFILATSLFLAAAALAGQRKGTEAESVYSHVRIVRLSFVEGSVLVKRPGSAEWAKALVNTPIEQGFTVSTAGGSFAEVEFENGSTARLGQLSKLRFDQLAMTASGAKINHLSFIQGYGTFHLVPQHGDEYTIAAGNTRITPRGKTEFRTDLSPDGRLRVEVFDGSVDVKDPKQLAKVTKGKVLEFNRQTLTAFDITHGIQRDSWDNWVQKRDQQVELAYNDSPVGMNSQLYGWGDLDAYGEWAFFPGFGYGWAPFEPAGWTPYSLGQWSWYPGLGYTWISGEPWGWLPFHTGFWNYDPGFGYFWMPGDLSMWYPALVDWYSGPGYIGWAPMGPRGAPACRTTNCIVAVRPGTLRNGLPVNPNTRVPILAGRLARISGPAIAPSVAAMLSGTPVQENLGTVGLRGNTQPLAASRTRVVATGVPSALVRTGAKANFPAQRTTVFSAAAPKVILMGQSSTQAAAELRAVPHASFFHWVFGGSRPAPAFARLGNTLGGQFRVKAAGRNGLGFRPAGSGAIVNRSIASSPVLRGRMMRANPVFLPHASAPGFVGRQPGLSRLPRENAMGAPAMGNRINGAGARMARFNRAGPTVRSFHAAGPQMGGFRGSAPAMRGAGSAPAMGGMHAAAPAAHAAAPPGGRH
ncbi:MAG: FecR family protein [Acidobacteria bacterium]|nr:FecR family protein [Acidobacteriota bacterium]